MNPGTPESIETAFVNQFREGFQSTFQQTESKLDSLVQHESQASEYQYWDRIGEAEEMQEDNTRYGDNPVSEIPHDRRRIGLKSYDIGKIVDEKDLMRVITDPKNPYSMAMLASGKRKRDDIINEGYYAPAYTGKAGDTVVNYCVATGDLAGEKITVGEISNGSSNKISASVGRYTLKAGDYEGISVGANYKGSATAAPIGLTIDKLKAIRTAMLRVEAIDENTALDCVMTSYQWEELLAFDEIINADFSVKKSLADGNPTNILGFNFKMSERLPIVGDERRIRVSLPSAQKLTIGHELTGDIWRLSGKKKAPYIYYKQTIGTSRMWGEVAGEIRCVEV
jgi:hypothetical protein